MSVDVDLLGDLAEFFGVETVVELSDFSDGNERLSLLRHSGNFVGGALR